MKYIIDYRYKTIYSISATANAVMEICRRGRSELLLDHLTLLQSQLATLDVLKSPPFSREQITQVEIIAKTLSDFLHLPDAILEVGEQLIGQCHELLHTLDPFIFSSEDSLGIRKSQIVEFIKEIQVYLKTTLLQLQGLASSIVEEKTIIKEIMTDIQRISQDKFKTKEKEALLLMEEAFTLYEEDASIHNVNAFFSITLETEKLFQI